jgi:hypothetical protein
MAGLSYTVGSMPAKVTADTTEAALLVAAGRPVVLVSPDAAALGQVLARAPDRDQGRLLLAVMVGDLGEPAVAAAAAEMAAELWPG